MAHPSADLTLEEFASAGSFKASQVIEAHRNGELFSCRVGNDSMGRYPAYQLLDEVRGQALRVLIARVGSDGGPTLYTFMRGVSHEFFGGADPVEVLCGRVFADRPLASGVDELLMADPFERLQAVLKVAQAWIAEDRPDEAQMKEHDRREAELSILSSTPWISRSRLNEQIGQDVVDAWLQRREVFCIQSAIGWDLFPAYGFAGDGLPLAAMKQVLQKLICADGKSIAAWFEARTLLLGDRRPRELLADSPARVVSFAAAALAKPSRRPPT